MHADASMATPSGSGDVVGRVIAEHMSGPARLCAGGPRRRRGLADSLQTGGNTELPFRRNGSADGARGRTSTGARDLGSVAKGRRSEAAVGWLPFGERVYSATMTATRNTRPQCPRACARRIPCLRASRTAPVGIIPSRCSNRGILGALWKHQLGLIGSGSGDPDHPRLVTPSRPDHRHLWTHPSAGAAGVHLAAAAVGGLLRVMWWVAEGEWLR